MAQLRRDHARYVEADTTVVVLGPEGPDAFADYWRKHDLPFIGLPDPRHTVLKLYGQEIKLFKWGRMPAQVLVDKLGVARFVHYGHDMTDIPSNDEVLGLIASLDTRPRLDDGGPA
jgi:peroxiredoxin